MSVGTFPVPILAIEPTKLVQASRVGRNSEEVVTLRSGNLADKAESASIDDGQ